mgnify:CR=1 FL=1
MTNYSDDSQIEYEDLHEDEQPTPDTGATVEPIGESLGSIPNLNICVRVLLGNIQSLTG